MRKFGILSIIFSGSEKILVITKQGAYYTTSFDLVNRYEDDILLIQKLNPEEVFSVIYFDASQDLYYIKRMIFDNSVNPEKFIDDDASSRLIEISKDKYPQVELTFKGKHIKLQPEVIDVENFVPVKSPRGKGKRLTMREVGKVRFIEPLEKEPPVDENPNSPTINRKTNCTLF